MFSSRSGMKQETQSGNDSMCFSVCLYLISSLFISVVLIRIVSRLCHIFLLWLYSNQLYTLTGYAETGELQGGQQFTFIGAKFNVVLYPMFLHSIQEQLHSVNNFLGIASSCTRGHIISYSNDIGQDLPCSLSSDCVALCPGSLGFRKLSTHQH